MPRSLRHGWDERRRVSGAPGLDFETGESEMPKSKFIQSETRGGIARCESVASDQCESARSASAAPQVPGAPGLDFETWEAEMLKCKFLTRLPLRSVDIAFPELL